MHKCVINHITKQIKIMLDVVIKGKKLIREWDSECLERAEGLHFKQIDIEKPIKKVHLKRSLKKEKREPQGYRGRRIPCR